MSEEETISEEQPKAARQIQSLEPPKLLPSRINPKVLWITLAATLAIVFKLGGLHAIILITVVIVSLSAIIMMHEGAHFAVAKLSGMKVTEYFVGFGPRIWSFFRGETEYGIKSIPAGGYVRIIGMTNIEEVDPADESRTYRAQGYWKRMATTIAGIVSHFILAFILIYIQLVAYGQQSETSSLRIDELTRIEGKKTPAQLAGIKAGDVVVSANGYKPANFEQFANYVRIRPNKEIALVLKRGDTLVSTTVTPVTYKTLVEKDDRMPGERLPEDWNTRGFLGVSPEITFTKSGFVEAFPQSGKLLGTASLTVVRAMGDIFSPYGLNQIRLQLFNNPDANTSYRFSSPVGITRVADDAAKSGWQSIIGLLIVVNLSLGLFNLIPLLPFDGGHVAIATYEVIVGRFRGRKYRVDIRKIAPVAYAVVGFLGMITLVSLYLDVAKWPGSPFE